MNSKKKLTLIFAIACTSPASARNFDVTVAAPLPTQVITGRTATAFFTITNNSNQVATDISLIGLPSDVVQDTSSSSYCSNPFTLQPNGMRGDSCTVKLDITGAVNGGFYVGKKSNLTDWTNLPLIVTQVSADSSGLAQLSASSPIILTPGAPFDLVVTNVSSDVPANNVLLDISAFANQIQSVNGTCDNIAPGASCTFTITAKNTANFSNQPAVIFGANTNTVTVQASSGMTRFVSVGYVPDGMGKPIPKLRLDFGPGPTAIWDSYDACTWQNAPSFDNVGPLTGVAYASFNANPLWVAVGGNTLLSSSDGLAWNIIPLNSSDVWDNFNNISAFNLGANSILFAVGADEAGQSLILTNTGYAWGPLSDFDTPNQPDIGPLSSLAVNFIANPIISIVGNNGSNTGSIASLFFESEEFWCITYQQNYITLNDIAWQVPPFGTRNEDYHFGIFGVAVGCEVDSDNASFIVQTTDQGQTWHSVADVPNIGTLTSVAASIFRFIAVGEHGILSSTDGGTTWNIDVTSSDMPALNKVILVSNSYITDYFLAVGNDGTVYISSPDTIAVYGEPLTWTNIANSDCSVPIDATYNLLSAATTMINNGPI